MTYPEDLARVIRDRRARAEILARGADKQLQEIREQQEARDAEKDADHPRNVARRAAKK